MHRTARGDGEAGPLRRQLPREQCLGRTNADLGEVRAHPFDRKTLAKNVRAGSPRLPRAKHDDVAAEGVPNLHVREDRAKRSQHQCHNAVVHLIDVEPLRHDAAGFQAARGQLVIFEAEHTAHAHRPWVRRLRDNHVIKLGTELEHGARVLVP